MKPHLPTQMCRNRDCKHNRRNGGCMLFQGLNFVECRRAKIR